LTGSIYPNQAGVASNGTTPPATAGTTYYFLQDHLGSSSLLVKGDGEIQEHLEYFPDGEVWIDQNYASINNGYRFTGKFLDEETEFYDLGQRFYDPKTSLWLGVDPLFTDQPKATIGRPIVMALYGYASNSSIRFIEPDGRDSKDSTSKPASNPATQPEVPLHMRPSVRWS
jgi:RHS repeat-associated protein